MVANSVVANRQARVATKAYLKRKLGLHVSDAEERSLEHLTARDELATDFASRAALGAGCIGSKAEVILPPPRRQTTHPTEVRIGTTTARVSSLNQIPVV